MKNSPSLNPPQAAGLCPETSRIVLGVGAIARIAEAFHQNFGNCPALIVADENTLAAAERHGLSAAVLPIAPAGDRTRTRLVFPGSPAVAADMAAVDRAETAIRAAPRAIPLAVGSGSINDIVKLAAYRAGRGYMVVATAASMDGYTAFGASITADGSKQTFDCPAPRVVIADLSVIAEAPATMASSGYADLLAKVPCGADWLLADALGIDPIDDRAWRMLQTPLRRWLDQPAAVGRGEPGAIENLLRGLLESGLAMQVTRSSRPASGAEHQFSHLWDMQRHTHEGASVSHGSKVAIGSIASTRLYEAVLLLDLDRLNIDDCVRSWPNWESVESTIGKLYDIEAMRTKALEESRAKWISPEMLRDRLTRLRGAWPALRHRLEAQLIPSRALRRMLTDAGAPADPRQIGISFQRLRQSFSQAVAIRRRYTILDLTREIGQFDYLVDQAVDPSNWEA